MISATVDMTQFNRGIAGLINKVGLNARVVVKKETGELIKTLVRVTPAAKPEKIRSDIQGKFAMVSHPPTEFGLKDAAFEGKTGVNWYAWNSHALYGVAREMDMTEASPEELKPLLYKITKGGRIRGQHGKQSVFIWKKILTRAATARSLASMKVRNMGRLKAGWMVSVFKGAIQLTGGNRPPDYVTRHAAGVAGYFIDSSAAANPSFTIANTARGASGRTVNYLANAAVVIRSKAMASNALFFMKGKKNLSDYAR